MTAEQHKKITSIIKDEFEETIGKYLSEPFEESVMEDFFENTSMRIFLYLQGQKEKQNIMPG
jgi:hypothetical protein